MKTRFGNKKYFNLLFFEFEKRLLNIKNERILFFYLERRINKNA